MLHFDKHIILRSEGSEAIEATKNFHEAIANKGSKEILRSRRSLRPVLSNVEGMT